MPSASHFCWIVCASAVALEAEAETVESVCEARADVESVGGRVALGGADVAVELAETAEASASSALSTVGRQDDISERAAGRPMSKREKGDALLSPVAWSFSIVVAQWPSATESAPFGSRPYE